MPTPVISPETISWFFGFAPLVIGLAIYAVTYAAKRSETAFATPIGQTFACASCGRRGVREHMLPQKHDGAVSWFCSKCGGGH